MASLRLVAVVLALARCSSSEPGETDCDPVALAKSAAGATARDCGHAAVGVTPSTQWQCAVTAFREGVPFRVSEAFKGIDSTITFSVARSADGVLQIVSRDSDPSGGSGAVPRTTRVTCRGGAVVASQRDGIDRIECTGNYTTTTVCGR